MNPSYLRLLLQSITFCSLLIPLRLYGQTKPRANVEPLGWGSEWKRPATEQQRRDDELLDKSQALLDAHKYRECVELCGRAIRKNPDDPVLYVARSIAYGRSKQFDLALADSDHALALAQQKNLTNLTAKFLSGRAEIHERQQNDAAAVKDLDASLKLNQNDPFILNTFAWLRATSTDDAVRNGSQGVLMAKKALEIGHEEIYTIIDTLAASYAENGDFKRAIDCEKRSMAMAAKEIKDAAKARRFQKHADTLLALFERHQPYHAATSDTE